MSILPNCLSFHHGTELDQVTFSVYWRPYQATFYTGIYLTKHSIWSLVYSFFQEKDPMASKEPTGGKLRRHNRKQLLMLNRGNLRTYFLLTAMDIIIAVLVQEKNNDVYRKWIHWALHRNHIQLKLQMHMKILGNILHTHFILTLFHHYLLLGTMRTKRFCSCWDTHAQYYYNQIKSSF